MQCEEDEIIKCIKRAFKRVYQLPGSATIANNALTRLKRIKKLQPAKWCECIKMNWWNISMFIAGSPCIEQLELGSQCGLCWWGRVMGKQLLMREWWEMKTSQGSTWIIEAYCWGERIQHLFWGKFPLNVILKSSPTIMCGDIWAKQCRDVMKFLRS